jgi:hypothetical protein
MQCRIMLLPGVRKIGVRYNAYVELAKQPHRLCCLSPIARIASKLTGLEFTPHKVIAYYGPTQADSIG